MKTSSAKAKGRRLQDFVVKELSSKEYQRPVEYVDDVGEWKPRTGDIKPAIMGESGRDIKLSPQAMDWIPYDIECKNAENWSIPSWWKQTTANTREGRKPLLVIKKNRHEPLVVLRWSDFKEVL